MREKYPQMIYISIPERHKKGGLHFHILIGNISDIVLGLVDSGKRVKKGATAGNIIYNVNSFKYGFSTATKIKDSDRLSSYVIKYLKKDLGSTEYCKKRFYYSKNCNLPIITKEILQTSVRKINILQSADTFMSDKETIYTSDSRYNYIVTKQPITKDLLGNESNDLVYVKKKPKYNSFDEFVAELEASKPKKNYNSPVVQPVSIKDCKQVLNNDNPFEKP